AATLSVVLEQAGRLGLSRPQRESAERLASLLGRGGDASRLVLHLVRCQQLQLLTVEALLPVLRDHLTRAPLERDGPLSSSFFAPCPEELLPPIFEVHQLLGRGVDAVRLADTPARQRDALACCQQSPRMSDAQAGLELARRMGDADAIRRLQEHSGDLLFLPGNYAEALASYQEAGHLGRVSECHEHLGHYFEALAACPAEQAERLARLTGMCQPAVDALVERRGVIEAAPRAHGLVQRLDP